MFTWWHRVREGTLKRSTFRSYMGSGPILVMSGEAWYIPHLYPEETRTAIP
jgi:hypothetical protein